MNLLDEYIITNKRCRSYGERVWMIKPPLEKDVGVFMTSMRNIIRLKMSSVALSRPCYAEGQIVTDGIHTYSVGKVHWYGRYYVCKIIKGRYVGMNIGKHPWEIAPVRAKIV